DAFASEEDQALDVRASLARSYRLLDTETAALFRDLSGCSDPLFAASQVADLAGRPECRVRKVLSRLVRAHLVSEVGPGRYSWNRLVAAYAAEQAGQAGQAGQAAEDLPDQGRLAGS
ncbi:transcriptional regulator, partial [Streptomyces sp. NPDC050788]